MLNILVRHYIRTQMAATLFNRQIVCCSTHTHTTHLVIGALLLLGHVSGTVLQHISATRTLHTTVSGVHSKRFGF